MTSFVEGGSAYHPVAALVSLVPLNLDLQSLGSAIVLRLESLCELGQLFNGIFLHQLVSSCSTPVKMR